MGAWDGDEQQLTAIGTPERTLLTREEAHRPGVPKTQVRVISVTSGKGGVGKSNLVINLAALYAKAGRKVLVLDADLGLANLDVLLGLAPRYTLQHVLEGEREMGEIIVPGPGGSSIIPAASGIEELTRLSPEDRTTVLEEISSFASTYDLLLLDTSAGISSNVVFFNLMADDVLVVLTPEPTSMTDAYAVIKVLSLRHARHSFILVINCVKSAAEAAEIFKRLQAVTNRFLDVKLTYAGHVVLDERVVQAVCAQRPVTELFPQSAASRCFQNVARSLNRLALEM
ncbi:MAG: MinD/ParA family protein [Candidatus Tectomicrobia bacterium]|nr:MinD/ParA family protein [Candidatus Tectomicrobia bacterium]